MEIDHNLDALPDRRAQRLHHASDLVDLRQGRMKMGIGNEYGLERAIAFVDHFAGPLDQGSSLKRLVDGAHIAEAKMRVDAHLLAHLAAKQAPHGNAQRLAKNVP